MKTKQSQLDAVAKYQEKLYWGVGTEKERKENQKMRERRRGQVYRSNGKTWAKNYASREELAQYIDELERIAKEKRE